MPLRRPPQSGSAEPLPRRSLATWMRRKSPDPPDPGPAGEQERLILQALVDLRDMDVREVMTPRVDVVALSIPVHEEDVAHAVRWSGHSAFPVVHDDLDHLVGVLYVTDLFRSRRPNGSRRSPPTKTGGGPVDRGSTGGGPAGGGPAGGGATGGRETGGGPAGGGPDSRHSGPAAEDEALPPPPPSPLEISRRFRQPYVLPESRKVLDALAGMRRQRRGFAIVGDEYGGVAGVLTVKDLLEPLVGDLHDELDAPDDEPSFVRVDSSRWLVDGRASVDEVQEQLAIPIPDGQYVTLAGFLLEGFGHIPDEGETLSVDGWDLRVVEMEKRRIVKVVASSAPAPSTEKGAIRRALEAQD